MKQIPIRILLTTAATAALLLSGCSKGPSAETPAKGVQLSLSIDGQQIPSAASAAPQGATRATAVDESAVNNLWVLQFQMDAGSTTEGTLVGKTYIATITNPAAITYIPLQGRDMVLYLVANSGNSSLFSSAAIGTTLAKIKQITTSVTATNGTNFPENTSTNLPMVGQSDKRTITPLATVSITLTRVASKIVLTVKNLLATSYPLLTINSVQLKNVANNYSAQVVNTAHGFSGTNYYPLPSAGQHTDYLAVAGNIPATGTTFTWYTAPNVRGVSSNTDPRLKSDATAVGLQGAYCTYVEIVGTVKISAIATTTTDVRYRLYLGGNNTNDFNLQSNTAYKVDVELTGINPADVRMQILTDKFDLVQGPTDGNNTGDAGPDWTPAKIGDFRDGGIVYWINPADVKNYKVVSLNQGQYLPWAPLVTYVLGAGDGQNMTNGRRNVNAMKVYSAAHTGDSNPATQTNGTFATDFPAAGFCDAKNTGGVTGWYLPARDELDAFYISYSGNTALISGAIATNGGTPFTNGTYLSGTEHSTTTFKAWYLDHVSTNTMKFADKNSGGGAVRCIKTLPAPPAIGTLKDGGIVFWVDFDNGSKYKVVSPVGWGQDVVGGKKKWAANNNYVVSGATSLTDGKANTAAIKAAFDAKLAGIPITETSLEAAFPAAGACYNYKGKDGTDPVGTWYLPALYELEYLWCSYNNLNPTTWNDNSGIEGSSAAQAVFDKYLTDAGGNIIAADHTWASTNAGDRYVWGLGFVDFGPSSSADKTEERYVRCIRQK